MAILKQYIIVSIKTILCLLMIWCKNIHKYQLVSRFKFTNMVMKVIIVTKSTFIDLLTVLKYA